MITLTPENCRTFRLARSLSKSELSRRANLSENYVGRLESGEIREPSAAKEKRIIQALKDAEVFPGYSDALSTDDDEVGDDC